MFCVKYFDKMTRLMSLNWENVLEFANFLIRFFAENIIFQINFPIEVLKDLNLFLGKTLCHYNVKQE